MSLDIAELKASYLAVRPGYRILGERVATDLDAAFKRNGLKLPAVQHRPKEVPNLVRKALEKLEKDPVKYAEPLRSMTDLAGARVIVPHLGVRGEVDDAIYETFEVVDFEDTIDRYEPHEVGYLGWHYLVILRDDCIDDDSEELRGLVCEIQVQTKAQNAWSDLSHPIIYKAKGLPPPKHLARRLNLAVGLIEMFDREVHEVMGEITKADGFELTTLYAVLERHFLQISHVDFDKELTIQVLGGLRHAYDVDEIDGFDDLMREFMGKKRGTVEAIFSRYRNDDAAPILLFQPEALAVYERLNGRPHRTREVWTAHVNLPIGLLEELATVFAV